MKPTALLLFLSAVAAPAALAQTGTPILSYSGALTGADPTFNRPASTTSLSDLGSNVAYEAFTFTTNSFAGQYDILADFRGAGGLPDGFLFLYSTFNPAQPLNNLLAGDDDYSISGSSEFLSSYLADSSSFGPAVIGNHLILDANTTYTVVVSGFANGDFGALDVNVTAVPEPGTIAAGLAGLALAARTIRRRRAA